MSARQDEEEAQWFCVRSRIKGERVAAAHLRLLENVDVFSPRIRYRKPTARGKVHFVTAMFPGYVFARFDIATQKSAVIYSPGVSGLVHFGSAIPSLDPAVIAFLREVTGSEECVSVRSKPPVRGETVTVGEGPLRGIQAVVQYYLPSRERVGLLMEFMGTTTLVEVGRGDVIIEGAAPPAASLF